MPRTRDPIDYFIRFLKKRGHGRDRLQINRPLFEASGSRRFRYCVASMALLPPRTDVALIATDESADIDRPLGRRQGWKQMFVQVRAGDLIEVDFHDLGPLWRRRADQGLVQAITKGATVVVHLTGGERIFLCQPIELDALTRLQKEVARAFRAHRSTATRAGMHKTREQGRLMTRLPGFGVEVCAGHLIPCRRELRLIRLIVRLHDGQRWTLKRIAQEFRDRDVWCKVSTGWGVDRVRRAYRWAIEQGLARPVHRRPWDLKMKRLAQIPPNGEKCTH